MFRSTKIEKLWFFKASLRCSFDSEVTFDKITLYTHGPIENEKVETVSFSFTSPLFEGSLGTRDPILPVKGPLMLQKRRWLFLISLHTRKERIRLRLILCSTLLVSHHIKVPFFFFFLFFFALYTFCLLLLFFPSPLQFFILTFTFVFNSLSSSFVFYSLGLGVHLVESVDSLLLFFLTRPLCRSLSTSAYFSLYSRSLLNEI